MFDGIYAVVNTCFNSMPLRSFCICLDKGFRCIPLRMSRIVYIFTSCHAEFNDPALQDAESNQDKRNKWSCLDVVHRDAACRRKLSAVYRRHHIGPGKRDHINKEDKLKGVVYNLKECFTSAGKNCNKLLDFDGKTFLAAVADA